MYFIELLVKKFKNKKNKYTKNTEYKIADETSFEEEPCNHIFMPIDETGEILACKNCGMIINKSEIKDKNPKFNFFMQDNKKD